MRETPEAENPNRYLLRGTLPVPPKAQPRPRCSCVKRGKGPNARHFPHMAPEKRAGRDITAWKASIVSMLRQGWRGRPPLNGPCRLSLVFVVKRPQSRPKVAKRTTVNKLSVDNPRHLGGHFMVPVEAWKTGGRVLSPAKPDLDRMINSVKDAITEAAVWWDDSQAAVYGPTSKWYAAKGEDPHIQIRVEPCHPELQEVRP